jgi:two-component sensor histidine kinase
MKLSYNINVIKLTVLTVISLAGISINCYSQTNYDSLRQIIKLSNSDSLKMIAAYDISKNICYTMPDSGIHYALMAYDFASSADLLSGQASACSQIGFSYNQKEVIDSAIFYWQKSAKLYKSIGDDFKEAYIMNNVGSILIFEGKYDEAKIVLNKVIKTMIRLEKNDYIISTINNLGLLYDIKGDYEKAYTYYQDAYERSLKINDKNGMGTALNNISVMYYFVEDYEKSIDFGKKALEIWTGERFFGSRSKTYKNIAVSFDLLGQVDSAIYYNHKALATDIKLKNETGQAKTAHNLGCLYTDQGDLQRGLEYLLQAKEMKSRYPVREGSASTYNYLGNIYTKLGNFKEALLHLNEGEAISKKFLSLEDIKDNLAFRIQHHEAQGNYQQAFEDQKEFIEMKDSLLNIQTKAKIADINIKYETSQKDLENEKLTSQSILNKQTINAQQKYLFGGLLGLGIISLISVFLYRQREKLKELNTRLKQQKDQIKILNQELNHRVKNNLAFMTSLLEMQGRRSKTEEAKTILKESENRIKALSLVHSNLFQNTEDTELNLNSYLQEITSHLEEIFEFPGKELQINRTFIDYYLNAEDAMRFGLIVNELFTNTVKHAFESKDKITISISTSMTKEGKLQLEYADNGPGIIKKSLPDKASSSLGMKLIELLKKQLGDKYIITLTW